MLVIWFPRIKTDEFLKTWLVPTDFKKMFLFFLSVFCFDRNQVILLKKKYAFFFFWVVHTVTKGISKNGCRNTDKAF